MRKLAFLSVLLFGCFGATSPALFAQEEGGEGPVVIVPDDDSDEELGGVPSLYQNQENGGCGCGKPGKPK